MGRDISISITAEDNYSQALKKMQEANNTFGRGVGALQEKLDALQRNKVTLKTDFEKAKQELKEARKGLNDTQESVERLGKAEANFDNIKQNLDFVNREARRTQREMDNTGASISRLDNRMATMQSSGGIMAQLGKAGAIQMIGSVTADMFSSRAGAYLNSSMGGDQATVANSILSSTLSMGASGAAMGSMIAPGIGTIVGGALGSIGGALVGWFNGETQVFENKDEAFKSYVKGQYDEVMQKSVDELTSGSGIAANREKTEISFATLFKDREKEEKIEIGIQTPEELAEYNKNSFSKRFLRDITEMANTTPYELDQLTSLSKTLVNAYGSDTEEIKDSLMTLGDTGSALGMTNADMQMMAQGIVRMKTTDKATQEYLNYFAERGVNVYQYLAEGEGKTVKEVMAQISKGKISGNTAVQVIMDYMRNDYGGSMEIQAQSFQGLTSTLQDAQTNLENAMGDAYNETRKIGLREQIDWYNSDIGEDLEDMNAKIGEWQAQLDNKKDEAYRKAMEEMMHSDAYEIATKNQDWGTVYALKAAAESQAYTEYMNTDGAKKMRESNQLIANIIQNDAVNNETYLKAGYEIGQTLSQGIQSTTSMTAISYKEGMERSLMALIDGSSPLSSGQSAVMIDMAQRSGTVDSGLISQSKSALLKTSPASHNGKYSSLLEEGSVWLNQPKLPSLKPHAYGLDRVPYDNYPALLHQGERVLTAQQARQQNSAPVVNITMPGAVIREEADVQKVARELVKELQKAALISI